MSDKKSLTGENYHDQDFKCCVNCDFHWIDFDGVCRCELSGMALNNSIVNFTSICDSHEEAK